MAEEYERQPRVLRLKTTDDIDCNCVVVIPRDLWLMDSSESCVNFVVDVIVEDS